MNLVEMYSKIPQDQRNSIGQQLLHELGGGNRNIDTNNISPQQLANLHQEAAQKDPGILARIRKHPLMAGVIGAVGAYEVDKHFGQAH